MLCYTCCLCLLLHVLLLACGVAAAACDGIASAVVAACVIVTAAFVTTVNVAVCFDLCIRVRLVKKQVIR